MIKRFLALSVLIGAAFFAAGPASAYIEAPYPLGRVMAEATNILVVQVEKVDKTKNLILYKKVQDLKGKHPTDVIRHQIAAGFNPREPANIMAWAEPGKMALIFHNGGASETCIDGYWYQSYAGGDWWNMSHAEPFLLRSFAGKPEKLAQFVLEMLAGREVIVPAMVDGSKDDLHLRRAKIQRLRASLKLQDYNAQRDFVGWGNEDFRRILGMPGFTHVSPLPRVDPDVHGAAAADFNGDGLADVCLYGESKVVLLKNEGTALSEVALPYVGGARGAAWADYNGDGKPDLLLAAPSGIRLLTNLGASFRDDTAGLPKEAYNNVTAATWIDYDGDGKPDILVSNGFLGLRLYRNLASKAGAAGPPEVPQAGPWHFIGPFDNTGQKGFDTVYPPEKEINLKAEYDGKGGKVGWKQGNFPDGQPIDLIPSFKPEQTTWCVVYLYREITVKTATELPIGLGSDDTLSVWLNGKNIVSENIYRGVVPDGTLATLQLKPGKNALLMKVCQGEGGYGFFYSAKEPKQLGSATPLFEDVSEKVGLGPDGVGGRARGDHLAVADVDGDGRPDFLCSGGGGVLALNTPKGFIAARDSGIRFQAGRVAPVFGDYDGDGKPDLFVPQNGVGKLFHNEGKGKFKETTGSAGDLSKPLGQGRCAVWVDLNNRGKLDLLVGCVRGPNRYFRNLGDGRFEDAGDSIGFYQKTLNTCGLAVLDLNKDGVMDLILANEGAEPMALLGDPARTGKK